MTKVHFLQPFGRSKNKHYRVCCYSWAMFFWLGGPASRFTDWRVAAQRPKPGRFEADKCAWAGVASAHG